MKLKVTASTVSVRRKLEAVERKTESPHPAYQKWLYRAAQRLRSFWFRRFDRFSRGGGNWKSTNRRKGSRGRNRAKILRKTQTLIRALSPIMRGLAGQWERIKGNSIETGYGGSARHPEAKMTVLSLARIHDGGLGIVPQRKIIVRPNAETRRLMVGDAERILKNG